MTFHQIVQSYFFNIEIKPNATDRVLKELEKTADDHTVSEEPASLSAGAAMGIKGEASMKIHKFTFNHNPVEYIKADKVVIEVTVGETEQTQKIIRFNWKAQYGNRETAEKTFNGIKQYLEPVSARKKIYAGKNQTADYAEFSDKNPNPKASGVHDVTFVFSQVKDQPSYQILLLPYNGFSK